MKVFLTIELDSKDKVFDNLENFFKVNFSDIDEKYEYDILKNKREDRISNLVTEISSLNQNIIIGFACYNLKELIEIETKMAVKNKELSKVFLPALGKRISNLVEGQRIYREHSRWIDWPPGYVEEQFEKFEIMIEEIKAYYKNTAVIIEEV